MRSISVYIVVIFMTQKLSPNILMPTMVYIQKHMTHKVLYSRQLYEDLKIITFIDIFNRSSVTYSEMNVDFTLVCLATYTFLIYTNTAHIISAD